MRTVLYVPLSDIGHIRVCRHCAQQVVSIRVRYYVRHNGRLIPGESTIPQPHRAGCGAHCAGARLPHTYRDGDAIHSALKLCTQCAQARRGSAAP